MEERMGWNSTESSSDASVIKVTYEHYIVGGVFLATFILGTFGNLLVIFAVFASTKLRTITNVFVVNLSIADLLSCLLLPFDVKILFSSEQTPLPERFCGAVAALMFTCTACSVYNLAIIAINRLLLIKFRNRQALYSNIYSKATIILWIVAPWMIGFLVTVLPPLLGVGKLGINQKHRICGGVSSHELLQRQELIQSLAGFPIPLGTIMFCYSAIYLHLRRHTKKMVRNSSITSLQESSTSSSMSLGRKRSTMRRGSMLQRKRQVAITKNMFYPVVAFVVCITPYSLCLVSPVLRETKLLMYSGALILMNSAINPVLYGFKHPYFRPVFVYLLSGRWSKVPAPSDTFKAIIRGCSCKKG